VSIDLHFRLTWAQRQFLMYLARHEKRCTLNPEAEAVKPHWDQIEKLKTDGAIQIDTIIGSTRKEICLTGVGENLVDMIKKDAGTPSVGKIL
jgi:hypothetical protein